MKSSSVIEGLPALLALTVLLPAGARGQTNSPGGALTFNGASQYVSVPSQSSLDAYPLTVMAWIKTTTTNLCAVVNKCQAGTTNGYQLFLNNGHILGFYFAGSGSSVPVQPVTLDGGAVNDGTWHHVALAVGATGAWLCKDGVQVDQAAWSGTPGPTTTTATMYFGYYPGITIPDVSGYYAGEIDEISLWNVALYPSQIATYMNRSLSGFDANLVGYWRLDEGSGATTADVSGNGNTAALTGGPAWTVSTAPVGIVPPTGYSQHWAAANVAPANWYGLAASADATRLAATVYGGGIYTSTNGGTNWQLTTAPVEPWFAIAGSADATRLVAANQNSVYYSTNFGGAWLPANVPTNVPWESVCCSADGSRMVAATFNGGHLYVSSDGGLNWSNTYSLAYCVWLACSSDGLKVAAVGPSIYTSTNGGLNWSVCGAPALDWNRVAYSADGTKLLAAVFSYNFASNYLYFSSDSGATWRVTGAPSNSWNSIAMSADGTKLFATLGLGRIYVSYDSGANWSPTDTASAYWGLIATSTDGTRSVALATGPTTNSVVTSLAPPAVHIGRSGSNTVVCWPSPCIGFGLQQRTNITGGLWSNVPIRPMVTNSQNQVSIAPSGHAFYRLNFP